MCLHRNLQRCNVVIYREVRVCIVTYVSYVENDKRLLKNILLQLYFSMFEENYYILIFKEILLKIILILFY